MNVQPVSDRHSRTPPTYRYSARYSLRSLATGIEQIEQVVSAKLLGVTFSHNFTSEVHVKNILTICYQRSYL